MSRASKIQLHVEGETLHGQKENSDWSAWAACVVSCMFPMPVEAVDSEDSMKQVEESLSSPFECLTNVNSDQTKSFPRPVFSSKKLSLSIA